MIPVYPVEKIREADKVSAEREEISSWELMERASQACTRVVEDYLQSLGQEVPSFRENTSITGSITGASDGPVPGASDSSATKILIFCGKGNNGGDGLAMARQLSVAGYEVEVWLSGKPGAFSHDAALNLELLEKECPSVRISVFPSASDVPEVGPMDVIVDALVGTGVKGPLDSITAEVVDFINHAQVARIFSVDIPSGLLPDAPTPSSWPVVQGSSCVSFQFPKQAFLFPESENRPARFRLVDIGLSRQFMVENRPWAYFTEAADLREMLPERGKFGHKGNYGRVLLVSGKEGMAGAAVLSSHAALRCGSGLVYVATSASNRIILQSSVPEAIYQDVDGIDWNRSSASSPVHYDVLAAGPGMGTSENSARILRNLLRFVQDNQYLVLDADALNLLALDPTLLSYLPWGRTVLTPHVGEFNRLVGPSSDSWDRMARQQEFSKRYGVIMVLKGAHTCITFPGELPPVFNSTGNPGMGTAGSGDVLTGMIASLAGQGIGLEKAVIAAVFLHGLAGDLAASRLGEYSLCAGDLVEYIPSAFLAVFGKSHREGREGSWEG